MTREHDVMRSLVELADVLVDDFDIVDLLTGLTERCVNLLDVSAAGVMIVGPAGELRLVASSSDIMRVVETFELQAREGPCLDAFNSGERVDCEDLMALAPRWPRFSAVAIEAGFMSVFAIPMRLRERTIGALNLFKAEAASVDDDDMMVARAFADLATISVLQHRAASEAQIVNEQLTSALSSRVLIEQAKGVVFERAGVEMAQAFALMRDYARSHNLRLTDVAEATIGGSLDVDALGGSRRPGS